MIIFYLFKLYNFRPSTPCTIPGTRQDILYFWRNCKQDQVLNTPALPMWHAAFSIPKREHGAWLDPHQLHIESPLPATCASYPPLSPDMNRTLPRNTKPTATTHQCYLEHYRTLFVFQPIPFATWHETGHFHLENSKLSHPTPSIKNLPWSTTSKNFQASLPSPSFYICTVPIM